MSFPLFLTLFRLVFGSCVYAVALFFAWPLECVWTRGFFLFVFGVCAFTDFLDGYYARKYNQVTEVGALLDPFADKVFLTSLFLVFLSLGRMPLFAVAVFVLRDFLVMACREVALVRGERIVVTAMAKHKTAFQMCYTAFIIAEGGFCSLPILYIGELVTLWVALFLSVVSGVDYAYKACRLLQKK